uniref:uncharacterized protein LOC105349504 n=1 Tax=Fragaria vesca subsp. vesca TaxID=101020 RepID=UPI0005CAECF1|nr:PREDICTED: uncharacterized protein LOC105349504 [Fragaria vesca subsp. vesca]
MSRILFWNARGAASDKFKSASADLVKMHSIDILAICESKILFHKAWPALKKLGFNDFKVVEVWGFSGGIWLVWNNNNVKVDFIDDNFQSISVQVSLPGYSPWMLSVIYASPNNTSRALLWTYLANLAGSTSLPWVLIGDFNELISVDDISTKSLVGRCGGLKNWISEAAMIDLGFKGSCFTWSNNRIKERLDRAFCNMDWRSIFSEAFIRHLPRTRSDHCPILLQLFSNNSINKAAAPFRFQAMWFSHEKYLDFVSMTWAAMSGNFSAKMKALSGALSKWNKEVFGHLFQKKKHILARLGGIQKACDKFSNPFLVNLEADLIHEYEHILNQESLFWRQKSRDDWIKGW